MLLKLELPEATALIVEKGAFFVALDVMFTFKDNTVVQNLVLELFSVGLSRSQYVHDIIASSQLTTRIVDAWENMIVINEVRLKDEGLKEHALSWLKKLFKNFKAEPAFRVECAVTVQILKGSKTWCYFGHLFRIANLVVNATNQVASDVLYLTTFKDSWKALVENERWLKFVEDVAKVYNAIAAQKLDPDYSSDSSSSDNE